MNSPGTGRKYRSARRPQRDRRLTSGASVVAGIFVWELVARAQLVSPLFLASPSEIVRAGFRLVSEGHLQYHLGTSLREFAVGFALAVVVGLPLSVVAGWYLRVGWLLQPLAAAAYAVPTIALFPLIILFLGIAFWDKVLLVFLTGVVIIFVTVSAGIRATDPNWLRVARSFEAARWKVFKDIVIPGAFPYIALAIRLSVGRCLVNVVVAEMFAAERGLGYMISLFGNTFRVPDLFATIVTIVVLGVIADQTLASIEKRAWAWNPRA